METGALLTTTTTMTTYDQITARIRDALRAAGIVEAELRPGFFAELQSGEIGAAELWRVLKQVTPDPGSLID